jgi:DNA-binding MarR family transcriptional regulator
MSFVRGIWLNMKNILRLTRRMINAQLEPMNLSGPEGDILYHLLTGSNGLGQERLARQLDMGKAAMSRTIDALELKGYVARARHPSDRRAHIIFLTEKGALLEDGVRSAYDRLYRLAGKGIDDEEFSRIESLLCRVAANFQDLEGP